MPNYTIPPRSKASDYAKGKLTQDEIISLQIANDANIAKARQSFQRGEVQQLTPIEAASPEELLADDAQQEATALVNLRKLGFRPQEVSSIITAIRNDPDLNFITINTNFPAIESDIRNRFNPKLLTPAFFLDYIGQFTSNLYNAAGMRVGQVFNAGLGGQMNQLINTVVELRQVIPSSNQLDDMMRTILRQQGQVGRRISEDVVDRIRELQDALPTQVDYQRIEALGAVDRQRIIQALQDALRDVPSKDQIDNLVAEVNLGSAGMSEQLEALANSVDGDLKRKVDGILKDIKEIGDIQSEIAVRQEQQGRKTPGKPKKERWDGESIILTDDEWSVLNAVGKKEYLQDRFDKGEQVSVSTRGAFNKLSISELDDAWDEWVLAYGGNYASGSSSGGVALEGLPSTARSLIRKGSVVESQGETEMESRSGFGIKYKKKPKMKVGRGIAVKETPSYREYGKYAIHIPQLENQDILNVKYKSLGQIPKFKPIAVSDIFRDFLIDLVENGKPNARVYSQISPDERKFFEEMSMGAGVWTGFGLKRTTTSTDEEEAKRFELLKGEYMAGNNNPKVISELRRLIVKMMNDGRIRKSQGVDLLMELSI